MYFEHASAFANAPPGASVVTDAYGTRIELPRTFQPPQFLSDRSPASVIHASSPFSYAYFATAREPNKKIKDERTVVIFIDGACSGNGTSGAEAGIGVYFGPNSPHNVSCSISGAQTSQRAELCAALRALEDAGQLLANNFRVQKVVLVCDSEYVVKGMTDWVFKWQENGWKTSGGAQVANKGDFERLNAVIERMEEDGLNVEFWRVGREYNQDADRLAREACVVRVVHSGFAVVAY